MLPVTSLPHTATSARRGTTHQTCGDTAAYVAEFGLLVDPPALTVGEPPPELGAEVGAGADPVIDETDPLGGITPD